MNNRSKKPTILIVDDVPENIAILGEILSDYRLKIATGGHKAIELATEEIDLILLDIVMPDMDGFDVIKRLKANPVTSEIPVIFLSVMSKPEEKVKGFRLGAVDYITKPFDADEIKSRIAAHISSSAYQRLLLNMNEELEHQVKQRTHELLLEKQRAEQASRLKSSFMALISHELRTPMTGILGSLEVLLAEITNPEHLLFLNAVKKSATRLHETLDSIVSLSNLEASRMSPNYSRFSYRERIQGIVQQFIPLIQQKKLELYIGESEDNYPGYADPVMFDLIFNNLISNAVKYSKGGKISIVFMLSEYLGHISDVIIVMDNGIGIPAEKKKTVFEEFRQADEGLNRAFEGVGLGLSLTKRLVELHGGKITLEDNPEGGSVFSVFLPRAAEEI